MCRRPEILKQVTARLAAGPPARGRGDSSQQGHREPADVDSKGASFYSQTPSICAHSLRVNGVNRLVGAAFPQARTLDIGAEMRAMTSALFALVDGLPPPTEDGGPAVPRVGHRGGR